MLLKSLMGIVIFIFAVGPVLARTPSPEDAKVYFITPLNGAIVSSPVTVKFGLRGMGIAPAGIDKLNTGHHHLLINVANVPMDKPIPSDAQHRHFGGGQTESQKSGTSQEIS